MDREIQEMWCWVNGPSSQLKFPITTLRILVLDIFVFFLHPYFIITNILHGVTSKGNVILRIRLALLIVNIIKDYCPPGNTCCGCGWNGPDCRVHWKLDGSLFYWIGSDVSDSGGIQGLNLNDIFGGADRRDGG